MVQHVHHLGGRISKQMRVSGVGMEAVTSGTLSFSAVSSDDRGGVRLQCDGKKTE